MTTTKLPTTCVDCGIKLTSTNRTSDLVGTLPGTFTDMCVTCYELDPEDDETSIDTDLTPDHVEPGAVLIASGVGDTALRVEGAATPSGRKNINHANCGHPRTPAGRAACRAARAEGTVVEAAPAPVLPCTIRIGSSSVVHLAWVADGATDDDLAGTACTKRPAKNDNYALLAGGNDVVTCKNCLKLASA